MLDMAQEASLAAMDHIDIRLVVDNENINQVPHEDDNYSYYQVPHEDSDHSYRDLFPSGTQLEVSLGIRLFHASAAYRSRSRSYYYCL